MARERVIAVMAIQLAHLPEKVKRGGRPPVRPLPNAPGILRLRASRSPGHNPALLIVSLLDRSGAGCYHSRLA